MNKLKRSLLLFAVCSISIFTKAQRINDFNLSPTGNGIDVSFSIGAGPDCSGYSILHCLDSMSYVEIYNFAGVCGTSGTKEFKSYTHTTAILNQINYYKIQLYPYEVAYNKILYSNSGQGSLLAYPNPVYLINSSITLKLANASNIKVEGYVCNDFGIKVQSIDTQSQGDLLEINISGYKEGVYLVWLSDGASVYSTKFIVLYSY